VAYFSSFAVPHFASDPSKNSAFAAAIYPHWRERRKERNGRRIVAQLNVSMKATLFDIGLRIFLQADESNENDPYVCFRRRDSKPIRKTRTGQNAITERMIRLKAELGQAYSLALTVLQREQSKRLQLQSSCSIWKTRATVLDLKRKLGSNLSKEDEELLVDKERPTKKPRTAENM
jgi:enhancer of polycomb-like protein